MCSIDAHSEGQFGYPLLKRNERAWKGVRGTARPSFLLAEAARSECAPSMRAVKDSLAGSPLRMVRELEGRKLCAVEPRPSSLLGITKKEDIREVL